MLGLCESANVSGTENPSEITRCLLAWERGNEDALKQLIPLIYNELRAAARHCLNGEAVGHTLQPTALINEVYLRLTPNKKMHFSNRGQFLWFTGKMMRHILVEHARSRQAQKRGAGQARQTLKEGIVCSPQGRIDAPTLLALDGALKRLETIDPDQIRIIELRFFGGLNIPETAEALGVSPATVKREWRIAKKWLARELGAAR